MSVLTPSTRAYQTASIKTWTLDAFRQLPEGPPFYELEDGKLIELVQPSVLHQLTLSSLLYQINDYLHRFSLGSLFYRVEVELSDSIVYVPDLCYVSAENKSLHIGTQSLKGSPDLVVEILSPSTHNRDRSKKFRVYEAQGIQNYWIVDPHDKLVWIYENSELGYVIKQIIEPGETFSPQIFPRLIIDLTTVWGELTAIEEKDNE